MFWSQTEMVIVRVEAWEIHTVGREWKKNREEKSSFVPKRRSIFEIIRLF